MAPLVSPCTRLCAIDHTTGLCAGCGRTLDEIGNWTRYDDAKRQLIMSKLPDRLAAMDRQREEVRR
jgi:uncharacterized protein